MALSAVLIIRSIDIISSAKRTAGGVVTTQFCRTGTIHGYFGRIVSWHSEVLNTLSIATFSDAVTYS